MAQKKEQTPQTDTTTNGTPNEGHRVISTDVDTFEKDSVEAEDPFTSIVHAMRAAADPTNKAGMQNLALTIDRVMPKDDAEFQTLIQRIVRMDQIAQRTATMLYERRRHV